jgi:hypothetical protein
MFTTAKYYGTCAVHGSYESFVPGCPTCSANPWPWAFPAAAPQPVTWPAMVPPVCTGSDTRDADFSLIATGVPSEGRCGICGQRVRLYDGQHLVTHPYRLTTDREYVAPQDDAGPAPSSRPEDR